MVEAKVSRTGLERFRVGTLPSIFYIPDFVSPAEESHLLHQVNGASVTKWKTLKNRRLQNWGGIVHEKGLIAQPVPPWLTYVTEKIVKETNLFPAPINHVLVNEYLPGQGITAHQDGPIYYPAVAILSLGCPTLMHFTPHARLLANHEEGLETTQLQGKTEPSEQEQYGGDHQRAVTPSVVLMPGSLLLFTDSAYAGASIMGCTIGSKEGNAAVLSGINSQRVLNKVVNMNAYLAQVKRNAPEEAEAAIVKDWMNGEGGAQDASKGKGMRGKGILRRTGTRVSLTCRNVSRVHKNFLRL